MVPRGGPCKHRQVAGVRGQLEEDRSHHQWLAAPKELPAAQLALLLLLFAPGVAGGVAHAPPERPALRVGSIVEQHVSSSAEFSWNKPEDGKWPQWLTDYVAFHQRMRGAKNATYLLHLCVPKLSDCPHGIGDRIRGLLPALQMAVHYQRVLLIHWTSPTPLDHFFLPAQINWTLTPDLGVNMYKAARVKRYTRVNFLDNQPEGAARLNRVWRTSTNDLAFTRSMDKYMPSTVPTFARVSWDTHCFFTALFQPSQALKAATDEQQLKLVGSLDRPYVAVHMRMGYLEGENQAVPRGWDHFQGLLAAYQCAWRRNHLLSASHPPSSSSILLLTDHSQLRTAVAEGMLAGMVGPDYLAYHIVGYQNSRRVVSAEEHERVSMTTYVDLMLLARAHCLVWSASGFPMAAMAMGFNPCTIDMPSCILETGEAGRQPQSHHH